MAKNLQELNKRIAKSKAAKKKPAAQPPAAEGEQMHTLALGREIASALREAQRPVVNIEARKPVSYRFTVNIDRSTGNMSGGRIDPITDGD